MDENARKRLLELLRKNKAKTHFHRSAVVRVDEILQEALETMDAENGTDLFQGRIEIEDNW